MHLIITVMFVDIQYHTYLFNSYYKGIRPVNLSQTFLPKSSCDIFLGLPFIFKAKNGQ